MHSVSGCPPRDRSARVCVCVEACETSVYKRIITEDVNMSQTHRKTEADF